jgi:hypothetical protein
MDPKRELALLRARPGRERAALLKEPPRRPSRRHAEALARIAAAGGSLDAEEIHFRTGLVLTARRWARLERVGRRLVFRLTEAGKDVLRAARD